MKYYCVTVLCLGLAVGVQSANILFLMGFPSPSHHIWNRALLYGLAASGEHNLTSVSSDIETSPPKNVHFIHLEKMYEAFGVGMMEMNPMEDDSSEYFQVVIFGKFIEYYCRGILASKGFQTLLNYPSDFKFDLVVHDDTAGPCLLAVLQKFKYPPLVGVTAFTLPPYSVDMVGGHKYPAYIPHYTLGYPRNMNFMQRSKNMLLYVWDFLVRKYWIIPSADKIMREQFPNLPYLEDLESTHQLLLVNTHPAIEPSEPLPPNIIPVGGLQLHTKPKELTKDFIEFINSSVKGTVLFSLGTNVRGDQLRVEVQHAFIKAFAQMPQYNFIWKFESEQKIPLPKNVIIRSWVPQSDILAHPKVVGFISHSGALSTHEAFWHGKPIISVPIFSDQHQNSYKVVSYGVGEKLNFKTVTAKQVQDTVLKVLETPSYTNKIKVISRAFQDQKETPLERAVWWIEWTLRNPNATYMVSPTLRLGYFRSNSFDVILAFLLIPILALLALCKFIQLFTKNLKVSKSKKNK